VYYLCGRWDLANNARSTIIDMDYILCIECGTIVEEGNPQELLQRDGGVFRRLASTEKAAKGKE
jgi:ABC-type multidrug transport system fused ATPase/permease subunit